MGDGFIAGRIPESPYFTESAPGLIVSYTSIVEKKTMSLPDYASPEAKAIEAAYYAAIRQHDHREAGRQYRNLQMCLWLDWGAQECP